MIPTKLHLALLTIAMTRATAGLTQQTEVQDVAEPKTTTVTQILTVTFIPTPVPTLPPTKSDILVTETVFSTVHLVVDHESPVFDKIEEEEDDTDDTDVAAEEEDILKFETDGDIDEDDIYEDAREGEEEDSEKAHFGFDFDYFSRRFGKISDASGKVDQPKSQDPGVFDFDPTIHDPEDLQDFYKLNEEDSNPVKFEDPEPNKDHTPDDGIRTHQPGTSFDYDFGGPVPNGKQLLYENDSWNNSKGHKTLTKITKQPFAQSSNNKNATLTSPSINSPLKKTKTPLGLSKGHTSDSSRPLLNIFVAVASISSILLSYGLI